MLRSSLQAYEKTTTNLATLDSTVHHVSGKGYSRINIISHS